MIGLDSNVLLRYLAQDDPVHAPLATTFIEKRLTRAKPGYINLVTLAEVVWTLRSHYKLPNPDIIAIIHGLLSTKKIVFQNEAQVFAAVAAFEDGYGFADALIGAVNVSAGCSHTFTFDQKAARMPGFRFAS